MELPPFDRNESKGAPLTGMANYAPFRRQSRLPQAHLPQIVPEGGSVDPVKARPLLVVAGALPLA
jgi:hypothetical protein